MIAIASSGKALVRVERPLQPSTQIYMLDQALHQASFNTLSEHFGRAHARQARPGMLVYATRVYIVAALQPPCRLPAASTHTLKVLVLKEGT